MKGLKTINEKGIMAAYKYQKDIGWTFHNEREITETILHNRFNFLLLAYSLFINAYFLVVDINDRLPILLIGFPIIVLLSIGIYRAYIRFMVLLDILRSLDDKDVQPILRKECQTKRMYGFFPATAIIGYIVPIVMIVTFIIGIVFNLLDIVKHLG